jgi:Zn-dependent peptidase ImmA (M78 family)
MESEIKTGKFDLKFDWLARETGNEIDRACFADLSLSVGESFITRLEDVAARTVRNQTRACAYQLAVWFASNWWRLRWEPEPQNPRSADLDWKMAHNVAAVGGGYVWPNASFSSEGAVMSVLVNQSQTSANFEPVKYLANFHAWIMASDFEHTVDDFIAGVIQRLASFEVVDQNLSSLWQEVLAERQDTATNQWRKLEALAGFDPDAAPQQMIQSLVDGIQTFGQSGVEELAAGTRQGVSEELLKITELRKSKPKQSSGGARITMPTLAQARTRGSRNHNLLQSPWKIAADLARNARSAWDLGDGPIDNKHLADLLGISDRYLTAKTTAATQIPFGLRHEDSSNVDVYLNKSYPTTRRFAVSRLLGDHLHSDRKEALLPSTEAKTTRQKIQRAFAQEFLCPYDALMEKLSTSDLGEEEIESVAAYFDVSPRLVATTLVNHGQLDRSALLAI